MPNIHDDYQAPAVTPPSGFDKLLNQIKNSVTGDIATTAKSTAQFVGNKINQIDTSEWADNAQDVIANPITPYVVGAGAVGAVGAKAYQTIKAVNSIGNIAGSGVAQGISQLPQGVMTGGPTGFTETPIAKTIVTGTKTIPGTATGTSSIIKPPLPTSAAGLGTAGMVGAGAVGAGIIGSTANTISRIYTNKNLQGQTMDAATAQEITNATDQAIMDNYIDNGSSTGLQPGETFLKPSASTAAAMSNAASNFQSAASNIANSVGNAVVNTVGTIITNTIPVQQPYNPPAGLFQ